MKLLRFIINVINFILILSGFARAFIYYPGRFGEDELIMLGCSAALIIIAVLRIVYCNRKNFNDKKEKTLNALFPILYYLLALSLTYSGYYEDGLEVTRGFAYMIFKNHQALGFATMIIMYLILWAALVYKTYFAFNKMKIKNSKKYLIMLALYVPVILILNFAFYNAPFNELSRILSLLLFAPIYYWLVYYVFRLHFDVIKDDEME